MRGLFKREKLPKAKPLRLLIGIFLLFGGILGFLPILGFWMIPLGLVVLSIDLAFVRRFRRKMEIKFGRKIKEKNKGI